MEIALPLLAKFKKAKEPEMGDGFILLEDAEHKEVVSRLKGARFRLNSDEIFDMVKSVSEAKTPPTQNKE